MDLELWVALASSLTATAAFATTIYALRQSREKELIARRYALRMERDYLRFIDRSNEAASYSAQSALIDLLGEELRPVGSVPAAELIREISHALNTPLAQIETVLEELHHADVSERDRAMIRDAISSIEIIHAVMQAYKSLTALVSVDEIDTKNLPKLVRAVFEAARSQSGKGLAFSVIAVPKEVDGYDNYFLLALLLPLLQNAAQSAPDHSTVQVNYERGRALLVIQVRNECADPDASVKAAREFRSIKAGSGHQGIGLRSVETLLSRTRNAELHVRAIDGEFVAEIFLPARGVVHAQP
ncbi:GHKL domain-containing protein [Micromonospora chalcea]